MAFFPWGFVNGVVIDSLFLVNRQSQRVAGDFFGDSPWPTKGWQWKTVIRDVVIDLLIQTLNAGNAHCELRIAN